MKKFIVIAASLAVASFAQAQLRIDVTGVSGSGVTTWTFSGTGTAILDGTMRDSSANTFSSNDSGQFPFGQNTILDTSIQDGIFALTGSVSVTAGSETRDIVAIYLDDDGTSADDLGVRVDSSLAYLTGDATEWSGSGTINVDIDTFVLGTWSVNDTDGQAIDLDDETIVTFEAVPEPMTMVVLGGMAALAARRRRKN